MSWLMCLYSVLKEQEWAEELKRIDEEAQKQYEENKKVNNYYDMC